MSLPKIFTALRYREYRVFWMGNAASNIGIWLLMAGRLWLIFDLTDSEAMLGILTFASVGPILVLSMWGGVLADRVSRVKLVTATRAMFAVTALLTGALIAFDVIAPWHLVAISVANGVLLSFDIPSRQAIVPNLLPREHLVNALSLQSMLYVGSAVLGPMFLPLMIKAWGIEGVFFVVGGAYVFTAIMFSQLKPQTARENSHVKSPLADLLAGFSYIRANRVMVALIAIGVVTGVFATPYLTLLPAFASDVLDSPVDGYGYLLQAAGIGGLFGMLALANFVNLKDSASVQAVTGVGLGVSLVAFALAGWLPVAIIAIGAVGAFTMAFGTINNTLLQSIVADDFRGRVSSIHQLGWGASAFGGLMLGFLAQSVSVPFALAVSGSIAAGAIGLLSIYIRRKLATTRADQGSVSVASPR
jgi:MFS family permease